MYTACTTVLLHTNKLNAAFKFGWMMTKRDLRNVRAFPMESLLAPSGLCVAGPSRASNRGHASTSRVAAPRAAPFAPAARRRPCMHQRASRPSSSLAASSTHAGEPEPRSLQEVRAGASIYPRSAPPGGRGPSPGVRERTLLVYFLWALSRARSPPGSLSPQNNPSPSPVGASLNRPSRVLMTRSVCVCPPGRPNPSSPHHRPLPP